MAYRVPARLVFLPFLQPGLLGLEHLEGRQPVLLELRRRRLLVLPLRLLPLDLARLGLPLALLVLWCHAQGSGSGSGSGLEAGWLDCG